MPGRQAAEIARAAGAAQWLERIEAWMMALQGGDRDAVPAPSIDPVRPPRSIGQRRVYVAHAERALSAGQHGMALAFADALLFGAAGPQAAAVLQLRGEALAAMGRTADADAAFLDARRRGIAVGPRPLLWKVAAARSRLWRNDDRTLSRQEADLARSELASLTGAMPEVRRGPFLASPAVRPWARPAAQHGTAIQTGTGGLTPREREVTILITRGLSNKEAARELGLSEKTVEMHVSSCLGKLGFASRAQLAAWAVAKELVDPTSPQG